MSKSSDRQLERWTAEKWESERQLWSSQWRGLPYSPPRGFKHVAFHEAGHAIAHCRFRHGFWLAKIVPEGGAAVPRRSYPVDPWRVLAGNMAGSFAQAKFKRVSGFPLWTASDDYDAAEPYREHVPQAFPAVRLFVRDYWPQIKAFALLLLARGFLECEDPDVVEITRTIERLSHKPLQ